jgi:tRNA pseudouridine65 synthase
MTVDPSFRTPGRMNHELTPADGAFDSGDESVAVPAELPVLYIDEVLAVIDKPAGLMVHDSALARGETDFAADRLRAQFGRPIFLVHRLDRATSGCLLLAFDRQTASDLGKVLMSREVEKDYLAVCRGWPAQDVFEVDHDLDGGPGKPLKKPAQTRFAVLGRTELALPSSGFETSRYALLRAQPLTGRFRQIRRHLKHLSHHLIGDTSHGDGRHNRTFRMLGIHRMLLHAQRLAFVHPQSGERIEAVAPPDAEFARALGLFEKP